MNQYLYDGPVMKFEKCVSNRWKGTTYAASESKARNNLIYQYKKNNNLCPNTKITLPGNIVIVQRKEE